MANFFCKRFYKFLLLLILINTSLCFADTGNRMRYVGTSIFSLPTGYVRSSSGYINDNGRSSAIISQSFMNDFLELSLLRHTSSTDSGSNIFNMKLNILEEGDLWPNIVWGNADFKKKLGSKISYFAGSKSLEAFGTTLHAGFYKDPDTDNKELFWGVEKMVFPLVILGYERSLDIGTYGMKLIPYPGVSVELAKREPNEEIYNIHYFRYF